MQNVVTYSVMIQANNPRQMLLPGMTANVHIVTDRREQRAARAGQCAALPAGRRIGAAGMPAGGGARGRGGGGGFRGRAGGSGGPAAAGPTRRRGGQRRSSR